MAAPLAAPAVAKSKQNNNLIDRLDNRRDAWHAGVVTGAVTAQVAGAAGRGKADRAFQQCQAAAAQVQQAQYAGQSDRYADYAAQKAGYDCEVQRYEARADSRKAAHRTGVVTGIVAREIVKD